MYMCVHMYIPFYPLYIKWITQSQKEWNNATYSNMDRPRDYPTKWSKSGKDIFICEI